MAIMITLNYLKNDLKNKGVATYFSNLLPIISTFFAFFPIFAL